jgi:AraC-like DNA-binding protein
VKKDHPTPFIERIWRSQSEHNAAPFISMAEAHNGLVITKYHDKTFLTVRGPETRATPAYSREGAEFIGITFMPGVFMPELPVRLIMDRHDVTLPEAESKSFWLNGSVWQYPDFENAETFVNRLAQAGLLVYDPLVDALIRGRTVKMSSRTLQRRFLQATGLTYTAVRQIERARYATALLKQGASILDTVYSAGYFDQPHLTRSLKYFIGLTPAQIIDHGRTEILSFLYRTNSPLFIQNMSFLYNTVHFF